MIIISVGDGAFYLPGYSNRQKMPTSAKLSETISNIFSIALVKSVHVTRGSVLWVEPKFSSWSLIPASFGRFSRSIGSFEADCSAEVHRPVGEPFSSFPNAFTNPISTG